VRGKHTRISSQLNQRSRTPCSFSAQQSRVSLAGTEPAPTLCRLAPTQARPQHPLFPLWQARRYRDTGSEVGGSAGAGGRLSCEWINCLFILALIRVNTSFHDCR